MNIEIIKSLKSTNATVIDTLKHAQERLNGGFGVVGMKEMQLLSNEQILKSQNFILDALVEISTDLGVTKKPQKAGGSCCG